MKPFVFIFLALLRNYNKKKNEKKTNITYTIVYRTIKLENSTVDYYIV